MLSAHTHTHARARAHTLTHTRLLTHSLIQIKHKTHTKSMSCWHALADELVDITRVLFYVGHIDVLVSETRSVIVCRGLSIIAVTCVTALLVLFWIAYDGIFQCLSHIAVTCACQCCLSLPVDGP